MYVSLSTGDLHKRATSSPISTLEQGMIWCLSRGDGDLIMTCVEMWKWIQWNSLGLDMFIVCHKHTNHGK